MHRRYHLADLNAVNNWSAQSLYFLNCQVLVGCTTTCQPSKFRKKPEISSKLARNSGFQGSKLAFFSQKVWKSAETPEKCRNTGNSRKFPEFWEKSGKKTGEQNGLKGVFARIWVEI